LKYVQNVEMVNNRI